MKKVKLPNGAVLHFPEKTSKAVIEQTVKRILGVKEGPELTDVMEKLAKKISIEAPKDFYGPASKSTEKTIKTAVKEVSQAIAKLDKETKDHYGPAIDKQIKCIDKQTRVIENAQVRQGDKLAELNEVTNKQLLGLANSLMFVAKSIGEAADKVAKAQGDNTKKIDALVMAQRANTETLAELVKSYNSPRKIIRDKKGKPVGFE